MTARAAPTKAAGDGSWSRTPGNALKTNNTPERTTARRARNHMGLLGVARVAAVALTAVADAGPPAPRARDRRGGRRAGRPRLPDRPWRPVGGVGEHPVPITLVALHVDVTTWVCTRAAGG